MTARTKSCRSPTSTAASRAACRSRAAIGDGPSDTIGIGGAINGLSSAHRDFLAAGGNGLLIGDGMLNYSNERILEAYYAYALNKSFTLTADYQLIANPAYNADRGPVSIFSGRLARRVLIRCGNEGLTLPCRLRVDATREERLGWGELSSRTVPNSNGSASSRAPHPASHFATLIEPSLSLHGRVR